MSEPYEKDAFWFSKLRVYRQCPFLYKLQFIDGVKIEQRSLDTEFGTALNLGLDAIVNQESDGTEVFQMYWETTPRDLTRFRFDWEQLAAMGPEMLSRFRDSEAKHYEPQLVGERIYGKMGRHKFEGEPDFYGKYKGKLTVIDFKTSGKNYPKQKIISDEQTVGYAHLLEQNGYKRPEQTMYQIFVKGFNYKLKECDVSLQRPSICPLTSVRYSAILSNIEQTCDEIASRTVFTKNPEAYIFGENVSPYFEMAFGTGVMNEDK